MVTTRFRRALGTAAALAAACGLLVLTAAPAAAHTRAAAASQWESRLTAVPEVPGLQWRTYAGGDLIELRLEGVERDLTLIVLGYEGEPYLRLTAAGVEVNRNAPATYLNAERNGDVALPPRADAAAAADWRQVSDQPVYAWHDHRVHWMAPTPPPAVLDAPRERQLVHHWTVPIEVDGQPAELAGELWWQPAPGLAPVLLLAFALTAPAAGGLVARRRGQHGGQVGSRELVRPAAAVVAGVALLNLLHLVDEVAAWPAPTLDILFGLLHTALFVGTGIAGAAIAWRGTQGPHLALGIASGAVLFHQGLLQWRLLTSSQLPTVWPPPLLRAAVALSIAQAIWVVLALTAALRAEVRDTPTVTPHPEPLTAAGVRSV